MLVMLFRYTKLVDTKIISTNVFNWFIKNPIPCGIYFWFGFRLDIQCPSGNNSWKDSGNNSNSRPWRAKNWKPKLLSTNRSGSKPTRKEKLRKRLLQISDSTITPAATVGEDFIFTFFRQSSAAGRYYLSHEYVLRIVIFDNGNFRRHFPPWKILNWILTTLAEWISWCSSSWACQLSLESSSD